MKNVVIDDPCGAEITFIFAHGAGADIHHDFMSEIAQQIAEQGIRVVRFNFPYMIKRAQDGKKRFPDSAPILLDFFQQTIARYASEKTVIGGKSMGGRMASHLDLVDGIKGIACLGFPFHPPKKPHINRGEHLAAMTKPTLILQGERDAFGGRDAVQNCAFSAQVTLTFIPDGCHGFIPRKASARTEAQNREQVSGYLGEFIKRVCR